MPGGAGGELRALAEGHVRPALAGEVVERGDADDAAADHDDPGMDSSWADPRVASGEIDGTLAGFGAKGKSCGRSDPSIDGRVEAETGANPAPSPGRCSQAIDI